MMHSDAQEVKRLVAELAVKKGFCTQEDVKKALQLQKQQESASSKKMLGMIMLENGIIDNDQFLTLLRELDHIVHDKA